MENYLNEAGKLAGVFDWQYMRTFLETTELPPRGLKKKGSNFHSASMASIPIKESGDTTDSTSGDSPPPTPNNNNNNNSSNNQNNTPIVISSPNPHRPSSPPPVVPRQPAGSISIHNSSSSSNLTSPSNRLEDRMSNASTNNHLDLAQLSLSSIPDSIFRQPWTKSLTTLDLSSNRLEAFPPTLLDLGKLSSLTQLNLSSNKLSEVRGISLLAAKLSHLDLSFNPIGSLPAKEIAMCSQLEVLNLQSCNLFSLPDELVTLGSLKVLNLSKNNLQELPAGIANCTRRNNSYHIISYLIVSHR